MTSMDMVYSAKALEILLLVLWNYDTNTITAKAVETFTKLLGEDIATRLMAMLSSVVELYQHPYQHIAESVSFKNLITDKALWTDIKACEGMLKQVVPNNTFEEILIDGLHALSVYSEATRLKSTRPEASKLVSATKEMLPRLLAHIVDNDKQVLSTKAFEHLCDMLGKENGIAMAKHFTGLLQATYAGKGKNWAKALNKLLTDTALWKRLCATCSLKNGPVTDEYGRDLRNHMSILCALHDSKAKAVHGSKSKPC